MTNQTKQQYIGVINANPRGFGFATTETGEEFFVPPNLMKSVVPGDKATFYIERGKKPGESQVAAILNVEREPSLWLGELETRNGRAMLVTDDPCFVGIELPGLRYLAAGQVVAVRVGPSSGRGTLIRGELIGVLGPRNRPGFDHDYAMAREDLKVHYDPKTLAAARDAGSEVDVPAVLAKGYVDMRNLPLVTIDGESTRDFDDAVYAENLGDQFRVHIAIADVSAYVQPNTPLDREARERCTSVYLPGRTVPMLPEALSTGLCSLNPGLDRLALVCVANVDRTGKLLSWKFERAVIRSQARLTYNQVFARMTHGVLVAPLGNADVERSFDALNGLFNVLLAARHERGVLDFNDVEPRLVLREDGEYDLVWEARNNAHRLVEEVMLLGNQAAAAELKQRKEKGIYRHQSEPAPADWTELREWLAPRGIVLAEQASLKELARTLQDSRSREDYPVIEARMRKVMQFAVYNTEEATHFSLGYDTYTHFTSPIRRYSDLLVHRILKGEKVQSAELTESASRCSDKSRSSRFAERFVWDRIKKRMLVRDVPSEHVMDSSIVAMNRRGAKVVISAWQCAAFVPAESLQQAGLRWNDEAQAWANASVLEVGNTLRMRWSRLEEDKSRCELSAILA